VFSDNTSQTTNNIEILDWFDNLAFIAANGIGRVNRNTNGSENANGGPRLYQYGVNIDNANLSKQITGLEITKTGGAGVPNIFAFTITEYTANFTPWPISNGFNADVIVDGVGNTQSRTNNDIDQDGLVLIANG